VSKYKIGLPFLGIVICFAAFSACKNVQKESAYIGDSANLLSSTSEYMGKSASQFLSDGIFIAFSSVSILYIF